MKKTMNEEREYTDERDTVKYFCNSVTDYRKYYNLTIPKMAELLGLSRSYVFKMETGDVKVSLFTAQKIANALGVKLIDLLPE